MSTVIEIPDDVSLDHDEDLDAFGPPTWRDRMAFGFALKMVQSRVSPLNVQRDQILTDLTRVSYELADAMIRESKYRVE